jgi:hypothetical protein
VPLAAFAVGSAFWVALLVTVITFLWQEASVVLGRAPFLLSVVLFVLAFIVPAVASRDPRAGSRFGRLALRAPYVFLRGSLWTMKVAWAFFALLVHPGRTTKAGLSLFALSPIAAAVCVKPHVSSPMLIASIALLFASAVTVLKVCFAIANEPFAPWIVVAFTVMRFSRFMRRVSVPDKQRVFGQEFWDGIGNGLRWLGRATERGAVASLVVRPFATLVLSAAAWLTVAFAFICVAVERIAPGSYGPGDHSLLYFIYESLLVTTTSGQLEPKSNLALVVGISHVVGSVTLITLVLFLFSAVSTEHIAVAKPKLIRILRRAEQAIRQRRSTD